MARKKISELESATDVTANDLIQIVDVEDDGMAITGTNKKTTASLLARELAKQPLEPGVVISGSSSGDAVRITQTGIGNAIVVEDSTNPDASPFIVRADGSMVKGFNTSPASIRSTNAATNVNDASGFFNTSDTVGGSSFSLLLHSNSFATAMPSFTVGRSRGTSPVIRGLVNSGDVLGALDFIGDDGVNLVGAANISALVDGTPSSGSMPGRIVFSTTPTGSTAPVEAMRITSAGNVGIGAASIESNCLLKLESTTKGFRPPSMTTTERNAISTPIAGLMIYNNSTNKLNFYNGSAWEAVTSAV